MKKIHAVIVFTDEAGEVLWGNGRPFEARKEQDPESGFTVPITVPSFSIENVSGEILDVHVIT